MIDRSEEISSEASSDPPVYVEARELLIRLAENEAEIQASQALRFNVFYQEMAAQPSAEMAIRQQDFDRFDSLCDHLLVLDRSRGDAVVGTYRILRRQIAEAAGQFYSADEFDLSSLLAYPGEIMELGRSCVHADYRSGATMQLLWRGIAAYVFHYDIDLMFGCASLPGTDPNQMRTALAYLHHYHLAPPGFRPKALDHHYVAMDRAGARDFDPREARQHLPPLIKGYLRLGGYVGDGAVVDSQFGTTDVCIVVKTDWVTEKYYRHYSRQKDG